MDKSLEEAKEWKPQIEHHLRKSNRFIVLISSHSVESKWVRHEGSMAYVRGAMTLVTRDSNARKCNDLGISFQE